MRTAVCKLRPPVHTAQRQEPDQSTNKPAAALCAPGDKVDEDGARRQLLAACEAGRAHSACWHARLPPIATIDGCKQIGCVLTALALRKGPRPPAAARYQAVPESLPLPVDSWPLEATPSSLYMRMRDLISASLGLPVSWVSASRAAQKSKEGLDQRLSPSACQLSVRQKVYWERARCKHTLG